jgi:hypothetical protein
MAESHTLQRRCHSLSTSESQALSAQLIEIGELQHRFDTLEQGDSPLHQYAHRVLGMSSRLASAGVTVEPGHKIAVLLQGLSPNFEDIRQLLMTKARYWKRTGEMADDEEVFRRLIGLIRHYGLDREGEGGGEVAAAVSEVSSPIEDSPRQSHIFDQVRDSIGASSQHSSAVTPASIYSIDTGESSSHNIEAVPRHKEQEQTRTSSSKQGGKESNSNISGLYVHTMLGFGSPTVKKKKSARKPRGD